MKKSIKILNKIRKQRNLSVTDEADRIGISRKQWYKIINDDVDPDYSTMCKIAIFFGKSVTDIFLPSEFAFKEQKTPKLKPASPKLEVNNA